MNRGPVRRKPFTSVNLAFRDLVYAYPGGVEELAAKMGRTPKVLYNKAEATDESHAQPTAGDLVVATVVAEDYRCLHAFADTVDHLCIPKPDFSRVSDTALLELINKVGAEGGDLHRAINAGLSDGRYTAADHEKTKNEAYEFLTAICEAVARLEGLIDE